MIGCLELTRPDQLDAYRLVWRDMHARTRDASYAQSFEWISSFAHRFAETHALRVLVASANGRTLGIVPLAVTREPSSRGMCRRLTFPRDAWGGVAGTIGPNPAATMMLAMRHLSETRRAWDAVDLRGIPSGSNVARTQNALQIAGFPSEESFDIDLPTIDLKTAWLEYREGLPADTRELMDRSHKHLGAQGRVQFVRYRPGGVYVGETDRRWRYFSDFERLLRLTSRESGALPTRRQRLESVFLRDLYTSAVDAGTADVSLLYVGEQPVAGAFGIVTDGRVEFLGMPAVASQQRLATAALMRELLLDSLRYDDTALRLPVDCSLFLRTFATDFRACTRLTHEAPGWIRGGVGTIAGWIRRSFAGGEETVFETERGCETKLSSLQENVRTYPRLA